MAKVLVERQGLHIKVNDHNGFVVVTLHDSADPKKRSEEWKREAKAGMSDAQWEQEHEINYLAYSGQRVFPEFVSNKYSIVVKPPYPEFGDDLPYYGGFDYGMRNPSSLHYYTIYDGVIYAVWELYKPCTDIEKWVSEAMSFPFYEQVRFIAADPTIFGPKTARNSQGLPCSIYDLFVEAGFTKLIKGNADERAWLAQMRKLWADPGNPGFRIFNSCPYMVQEFENATYKTIGAKMLNPKNQNEVMTDYNNHAMDDCKYFMSVRPSQHTFVKVKWPDLAKTYRVR